MSGSILPVFSPRSVMVSGFTFKSLIHFECIFVYGVRKCSNFILLHVAVQFSQHHLLKRLSSLHHIFLPPFSKIRCPQVLGFTSGLSGLFVDLCVCFCASTIWFDGYSYVVQFEIREGSFLLSQDCFGYSGTFVFPYKFYNYLFQFYEKCYLYLIGSALDLQITLGNCHF